MRRVGRDRFDERRKAVRVVGQADSAGTSEEWPVPGSSHATTVNSSGELAGG
jgi:hypothetical protein